VARNRRSGLGRKYEAENVGDAGSKKNIGRCRRCHSISGRWRVRPTCYSSGTSPACRPAADASTASRDPPAAPARASPLALVARPLAVERPSLGMGFREMALDSIQLPPLRIDNSDGGVFPTAVGNARLSAAAGRGSDCWTGFSLIGSDKTQESERHYHWAFKLRTNQMLNRARSPPRGR
jgi:hypothetical protein